MPAQVRILLSTFFLFLKHADIWKGIKYVTPCIEWVRATSFSFSPLWNFLPSKHSFTSVQLIPPHFVLLEKADQMIPNLDLLLLAFLYGSFIACVLLQVLSVILLSLCLAFSVTLFSIVLIDLHYVFSVCSLHYITLKANLQLGSVLILYIVMRYSVPMVLTSKASLEQKIYNIQKKRLGTSMPKTSHGSKITWSSSAFILLRSTCSSYDGWGKWWPSFPWF